MTAEEWYRSRIRVWTGRRDRDLQIATRLSRLRLVSFLGGAGVIWWALASLSGGARVQGLLAGAAAIIVFGALVVRHARVLDAVSRSDAALQLNAYAIARLARDWNALREVPPPSRLDFDAHPYARDLDIFGHASLTKWLGRAATLDGARRLHEWLLAAASPEDIVLRQSAVDELAPNREWRETLAIEGELTAASAAELARFLSWAESTESVVPKGIHAAAIVLPIATAVLFALLTTGVVDAHWWLIPFVCAIVLSFGYARRMFAAFDRVTVGERSLERYAAMFELACGQPWNGALLGRLKGALCVGGAAPIILAQLSRLAGWSELRVGAALLHFPIQSLTMWDFHVYFALERWRARSGRHVRGWIEALAEVDALAVLANVRADQPEWVTPRVDPAARAVEAIALGHPLISDARRVANDVVVGPPGTIVLITGSNMSGKSTLLRALGLNTVLAQAGAPVCAATFTMPPADLHTSIRVQDSLELGLSYFMAALARLKQIVDMATRPGPQNDRQGSGRVLMYLLDEVLQGTNSVERGLAVRAVVSHLIDAGAIGVMTTHDLALADEEPLKSAGRLAHFTEQVHPDGRMTFDYHLRPGLATSTNALRLMQLIGIPAK
jgi:ABC-type multidrug transport system fused ATPase/permease subunit